MPKNYNNQFQIYCCIHKYEFKGTASLTKASQSEHGKRVMIMHMIFLFFCYIGIAVLAEKHGIAQTAYLEKVDNVIVNSSLLAYFEPCK